jgi:hypothetical protein
MAEYKVQLKDKDGNKQYPVTTTDLVVGADGKTVEQRLKSLEGGSGGTGGGDNTELIARIEALEALLTWETIK